MMDFYLSRYQCASVHFQFNNLSGKKIANNKFRDRAVARICNGYTFFK